LSENELQVLMKWLPLLIPVLIIQFGLMVAAIIVLSKQEKTRGPKGVWILVILLINFIGPILYFVIGREEG
jgi:hypothetical protein